jgi:hypothetical protein
MSVAQVSDDLRKVQSDLNLAENNINSVRASLAANPTPKADLERLRNRIADTQAVLGRAYEGLQRAQEGDKLRRL